jgi:cell division protein ZipA
MDRDTVRLILLVIGIAVIAGVYLWGRYKDRTGSRTEAHRDSGASEEVEAFSLNPADEEAAEVNVESFGPSREADTQSPRQHPPMRPEAEDIYSTSRKRGQITYPSTRPTWTPRQSKTESFEPDVPPVIQLSIIARDASLFSGDQLYEALSDLGLKYGEMGIFHRYCNHNKDILFSVASLVEPGTFPVDNMGAFRSPGLVLFFAPSKVDDSLIAFDQLVHTCHELAVRLDGMEWDDNRKPLTPEKITAIRNALDEAY